MQVFIHIEKPETTEETNCMDLRMLLQLHLVVAVLLVSEQQLTSGWEGNINFRAGVECFGDGPK